MAVQSAAPGQGARLRLRPHCHYPVAGGLLRAAGSRPSRGAKKDLAGRHGCPLGANVRCCRAASACLTQRAPRHSLAGLQSPSSTLKPTAFVRPTHPPGDDVKRPGEFERLPVGALCLGLRQPGALPRRAAGKGEEAGALRGEALRRRDRLACSGREHALAASCWAYRAHAGGVRAAQREA